MLHVIAVLLTIFPGFGLGYALLGLWKPFRIHFFASLILGAPILAVVAFEPSPIASFFALVILPLLTWNLYHAHRLWVDDPDNQLAGSGSREPLSFTLAPAMVKIAFGLAIVITVSTFLCRPAEKPKPTPTERYAEWVEENLDRHVLSEGVELYDDQVGMAFYRHHVEPGSYILDIYKSNTTDTIVLTRLARNVKQNSSENQLVYLFGNRVYRLHTQSEVALQDLGYDLLEEVKGDCLQNWGRRRCGWLVE